LDNFLLRRGERERGRAVLVEFRALKEDEDRLKELRAAIDFDPTQPEPKAALVDTLIQMGRLDEALEETTRFVSLGSMEPIHHALAARVRVAAGDPDAAEKAILRAIELDPENERHRASLDAFRGDRDRTKER
jgi:tetratricopeptide (TPR) repeat protein